MQNELLGAANVAPDRRRPEDGVAERVVVVVMRVDDRGDRQRRQLDQMSPELAGLCASRSRVDDDRSGISRRIKPSHT